MIQYDFLPIVGGGYEEEREDKSLKSSSQKKECQKIIEKIEGRKKVSHVIRSRTVED